MNKNRFILIGLCAVLCVVLFKSCAGKPYIKNSFKEPTVKVSEKTFDITVDEFIDILNSDIKKEKLDLIPTDYEVCEHEHWTAYRCKVDNRVMIRFVQYKDEGDGLVRAGISYLQEGEYENPKKATTYTKSIKDQKKAIKYYEILCDNVEPRFKAKRYCNEHLAGFWSFELDDLTFFGNIPSCIDDGANETLLVYDVISSKELYKKYEEEIEGDDDIYFEVSEE